MNSVFLGGSRKISKLNNDIKERINNIINQQFAILIGDANGADKAFQSYLKEINYSNVYIYCSGSSCRNNLGNWKSIKVGNDVKSKNIKFYMLKDMEMAKNAEYAFMLWDGKSAGTLNNILNMLSNEKTSLIYFSPQKKFYTIKNINRLLDLLNECNLDELRKIDKKIKYEKRLEDIKANQYDLAN